MSKEYDFGFDTGTSKRSGDSSAVAAIIARTTKNPSSLIRKVAGEVSRNCLKGSLAGSLHQQQGGRLKVFDREAVNLPHLFG
jgi:hypothetical protein